MATTQIRKGARVHLYIKEHMEARGVTDDMMAGRLGLSSRSAVWKRYTEQHRLDFGKAQEFADALGMPLAQLFYPPGVPSLDAIAADVKPPEREKAAEMLRLWLGKAS